MRLLGLCLLLFGPPDNAGAVEPELVPFPLEPSDAQANPRPPAPLLDLRDPFRVDAERTRGERRSLGRLGLPDLKDPFSGRQIAPRGWTVELPGDIRDPFSPKLKHRAFTPRCVNGRIVRTIDGVSVQRPGDRGQAAKPCRIAPMDLRDPFAGEETPPAAAR